MQTSQTGFWYRLVALLLSLLLAACGGNTGGGNAPTTGTVNTPGGPVQVALQGGSFTQGPTSAQVNAQGFQTPYGGIRFTAQVPQTGGTLTVTLTFPQDLPQGAVLLKCLNGNCTPIQGAQLQGRTATFQVRDGGPLDADGQANGRIQDPVALGVPNPDFTLSLNPTSLTVQQGGSGTTTLTLTPQNGFTGQVSLTLERQDGSPAPQGISLSPTSVSVTGPNPVTQALTLSVAQGVQPGTYPLRVKATSGNLSRTANLSLTVQAPPPAPDFTLSLNPTSLTVQQGGSGTTTLTLTPQNGFTGQVSLSVNGALPGMGVSWQENPWSITGPNPQSQVVTVSADATVSPGDYTLTVTATGGSVTRTATLQVTVQGGGSAGQSWRVVQTYPPLNEVTYGNGLFVAVGDGGAILTSPDGVSWTAQ
uniref:COG1470 family protein n=1 Tax=Thermus caldifontis TaxID=1930763 RepID=UPI001F07DC84